MKGPYYRRRRVKVAKGIPAGAFAKAVRQLNADKKGNEWKATGKVVKQADGPIYKQAGNAVSVPVAEWIGRRIGEVL